MRNFWNGFEKKAFGIDPVSAGTLGSLVSGYHSGRSAAGTTANAISRKGYKTKNEETARNIAKVLGTAGAVGGLALAFKNQNKLVSLARKYISSHPEMHQVYAAGIPFAAGTLGGMGAGALTGGAVSLRGAFSKSKEEKK